MRFLSKKSKFFSTTSQKGKLQKKIINREKNQKICKKFKVKFLVNDDVNLAKKLNADGCHLGQKDMSISDARKLIGKK